MKLDRNSGRFEWLHHVLLLWVRLNGIEGVRDPYRHPPAALACASSLRSPRGGSSRVCPLTAATIKWSVSVHQFVACLVLPHHHGGHNSTHRSPLRAVKVDWLGRKPLCLVWQRPSIPQGRRALFHPTPSVADQCAPMYAFLSPR